MKNNWGKIINSYTKLSEKLGSILLLNAVEQGLTLMIPTVLIGSAALIITSFPSYKYQSAMNKLFGTEWKNTFIYIHDGTINILSLVMVICISYSYIVELDNKSENYVDPVVAALVSLCSFVTFFGINKKGFSIANYGVIGAFMAIIVAVTSSMLFHKLCSIKKIKIKVFTDGDSVAFNSALESIVPAALTIAVYAIVNQGFIAFFGIYNIQSYLSDVFTDFLLKINSPVIRAVLFTFLIDIFWLFGIHGGNVLEPVTQRVYARSLIANQILIDSCNKPMYIFTKPFFYTFIFIGGSGAVLCLIIAIFISGRNKNQRRIAKLSIIPVIFNISELIIFGAPIVFNPVYIIPFLTVPVILTLTSYAAIRWGLVPYTRYMTEWTTPIFISGYTSTGSINGSFLQLFNLILGILCYIPFVKLADKVSSYQAKKYMNRLYTSFKKTEESGVTSNLLKRHDYIGNISRLLAADMITEIENKNITLYYQPQVDYEGNVFCTEALLRWNHRTYGYIYPPLIIELAEESNVLDKLGYLIFDTACSHLKKLNDLGYNNMSISVNISAVQLEDDNFVENLKKIIQKHNINPESLKIEITEQMALSGSKKVLQRIMSIKKLGVKLEMDDFGMGHSTLMYLKDFNVDTIKLDGSFVRDISTNTNCRNIISSIVYLSKSLNYSVLAEFVENDEQRSILHSLGCDRYQGYLFSKALPFDDLVNYMSSNHKSKNSELELSGV